MSYISLPCRLEYSVDVDIPDNVRELLDSPDEKLRAAGRNMLKDDGFRITTKMLRIRVEDIRTYHPFPDIDGDFSYITRIIDKQGYDWKVLVSCEDLDTIIANVEGDDSVLYRLSKDN